MKIFDEAGQEQTEEWLREQFGDIRIVGQGQWRVEELRARTGPTSCDVRVRLADGSPATGVMALWSWPDGHHRQLVDRNGYVGFVIDAYYRPPEGGPYWLSLVPECDSQTVYGIGMVARTDHRHVDVIFQRSAVPPVPPDDDCQAKLEENRAAFEQILDIASAQLT